MITKTLLIALSSVVLFKTALNADPVVYVVSAGLTGDGHFGTMDLTTGAYQQVGPVEPDGYFGLASGPSGSLLAGTYAANLDSINPITGAFTLLGPTGLGACVVPSSSCGPNTFADLGGFDGKIYATDLQNNLYKVSPMSGAATLLNGHTGIPAIPFLPGTTNSDGTLNFYDESLWGTSGKLYATFDAWVFDPNSLTVVKIVVAPELYQIDPSSGNATVIGDTDLAIGAVTHVNGTSYAFNDLTNQITAMDLSSGKTSFVSSFDSAAGVIQGAANAAPEPSSVALAVVGLIGLVTFRRRKRRSQPV